MTIMTSGVPALGAHVPHQADPSDLTGSPAPSAPALEHPVAAHLAHLLFEGAERDRRHGTWRAMISGHAFSYRPDLSPADRAALSYDRLRLLNGVLDDPARFAADPHRLAALHEWIGPVDGGLTTLASIHYNLFLGSLVDHDDKGRDLSAFTSLQRTGTFLCTELEHGNDVAAMETVAVHDRTSGGFHLHTPTPAARKFMPNTSLTGGPKTAVVAARLILDDEDQGVFLFLTPLSDHNGHLPGVTVHRLPERTGTPVDHSLTSFDHLWLPRQALLEAEHGRLDPDGTLTSSLGNKRKRFLRSINRVTMGKLCMSAGTLGMARAALTIAVRYAHSRLVAGPRPGERIPIAAHRSHHTRLLDALATAYAMTFLHRTVVDRFAAHTEEDREEIERLAAIAKGWITWQARDITTECRERCGAQGLFPANGIADLPANIEGGITAEGDNLVIWVKAASEMVFGHRSAAPDALPAGDLTDLPFLRGLLAQVEAIWQARARTALREGPSGDPVGRWNVTSSAALEMVSAHARLRAADAFAAAAEQPADPRARRLLGSLCRLFLLRQIDAHTGDLLADGHMTPDQVRALPKTLDTLVADLAPHMMTLVDAFDFPAKMLSAIPIASGGSIVRTMREGETGTRAETEPPLGAVPGSLPGAGSGSLPGADAGAVPGSLPGAGSGSLPGADAGAVPGALPGADARSGPGALPGADAGSGPGPLLEAGARSGPGPLLEAGAGSGPGALLEAGAGTGSLPGVVPVPERGWR
ncbi:acyl-CoA dehydrogenase [Streptomyces sp. TP-A0356]|uniref:acyl-CoA dehydrogenase family protein n=1 Tax=Streptomyces sp. TP-A0356 TaxID=1359208 RepID=UPI000AD16200|nr:acyl-CoA dehydrogenase [Streptomyces sp. TP-A0356]